MSPVTEIPKDVMALLFGAGPKLTAIMAIVAFLFGVIAVILGIVSAIIKKPIGLGTTNWFLLTIIFFIWNLIFWFTAYFGAKEGFGG
jgi:hypothetical protein